tara:strand:- start:6009 stop:7406 length:1398 start_codon:yes stop_codon:yes gene_type:complete
MAKENKSALKVNERLIKESLKTHRFSGGAGSTTSGQGVSWNNQLEAAAKKIMAGRMIDDENSNQKNIDKKTQKNNKTNNNTNQPPVDIPEEPPKTILDFNPIDGSIKEIPNPAWKEWNTKYGGSATKQTSPVKQSSSFKRYSALKSRTRDSYIPTSSPMQQQADDSDDKATKEVFLPTVTIWDTFNELTEASLDEMAKDHANNTSFDSKNDDLINVLQNPKHRMVVKNYLKDVKTRMINALNDGQIDIKDEWMNNVKNLQSNIGMYANKYQGWVDMVSSGQFEEAKHSKLISKGSHKGDKRKYDLTYIGSDKINMSISEEGDMYFKVNGINDDIWTVKDLDKNVFSKNFKGYKVWDDFLEEMKQVTREGGQVNEGAIEAVVESLAEGKDSLLSWFYDFGLFEELEKATEENNIKIDIDQVMPESERFNIELLEDLVKNGLVNMAKTRINMPTNLSAKDLIKKYSK